MKPALTDLRSLVNTYLKQHLQADSTEAELTQAMAYSLLAGGSGCARC